MFKSNTLSEFYFRGAADRLSTKVTTMLKMCQNDPLFCYDFEKLINS